MVHSMKSMLFSEAAGEEISSMQKILPQYQKLLATSGKWCNIFQDEFALTLLIFRIPFPFLPIVADDSKVQIFTK